YNNSCSPTTYHLSLHDALPIFRQLFVRFSAVQGHRTVVGTPADIADQIEDWFLNGAADGFNLKPSLLPDDLQDFIDLVVPELQRSEEHTSELQSRENLVCRLLL